MLWMMIKFYMKSGLYFCDQLVRRKNTFASGVRPSPIIDFVSKIFHKILKK